MRTQSHLLWFICDVHIDAQDSIRWGLQYIWRNINKT